MRKANIWRNKEYGLFEDLLKLPLCSFCSNDKIHRNGYNAAGEQKYMCLKCSRQFTKRTTGKRSKNKKGEYKYSGKYWQNRRN